MAKSEKVEKKEREREHREEEKERGLREGKWRWKDGPLAKFCVRSP